jgi:myo-inositol 2-dehydrogenase / D-chiro-inositol 1-dehydrogenase
VRFAVLGTGRMGGLRAALLAGRADVEEVVLAGGDRARTAVAAERAGARAATVEEALGAAPDGVVVASATARHGEHLRACAELGAPVLCEKPLALTVADTEALIETLERAGVVAQIGFQRRFDPGVRALHALVADGAVGTVYSVRITARDAEPSPEHFIPTSGGMFRDMHVHDSTSRAGSRGARWPRSTPTAPCVRTSATPATATSTRRRSCSRSTTGRR